MIDTAQIRPTLYNEYLQTMHQESWRNFDHFLLVKILRLRAFKRKVYEAYTPGKHCRIVDLEQVLLEELGNED